MASSTSTTSKRASASKKSTGRKSATAKKTSGGAKRASAKKTTSAAPVSRAMTSTTTSAYATPEKRLAAAKPGTMLVRRFDEHRELAQLATRRFQTTAARPDADPTKQSGVTTANIADVMAALAARKTTADKLLGVPTADVIRYAERGELSKRAEQAELTKKLREFSLAVFGTGTRNKLRGKRIAAALSVLMAGGTKTATSAAKRQSRPTATKRSTGRKSTTTGRKQSGRGARKS